MHAEKLFARFDNLNTEVSALVEGIRYFYWDVVQLITWRDVPNCLLYKCRKYKEAMQRNCCSADNKIKCAYTNETNVFMQKVLRY